MRTVRAVIAALVLLAASTFAAPAGASADEPINRFRFVRHSITRGDLIFTSPSLAETVRLRAGSGSVSDECVINFGGIPRGAYDMSAHEVGLEGQIAGFAWALTEHQCYDGTFRTDLLIHSEMSPDGGQDDTWEPNVWTDANPDDYTSFGCIKISYTDALTLEQAYQQAETGGYPTLLLVE